MANKIQLRRGLKSDLPTLASGEPGYITDTRELYIGTGGGNVNMGGSHWYIGTAMSGTSSAANTYSYSGCPDVKLDDIYLNTNNGNIYTCTTAGSGTNAKWTYRGNIKGAKGDTGATGAKGDDGESAIVDSELSATSVNPVQNKVITEALDLKADSSDFYKHGYAGAGEVVDSVSELTGDKLAPPTTIVIACTASNHKEFADYVCDNRDSTAVFQNTINVLPSGGGKIAILEGTYNINGSLNCNKDIVFEGMGNGTVLNFNEGSHISQADISITLNKLKINFISGQINTSGQSFIGGIISGGESKTRRVNMTDCVLKFMNNNFVSCALVFNCCGWVKISKSSIELINNAVPANSSYTSRINIVYDEYSDYHNISGTKHRAEISDCDILCRGKVSGSYKAWSSISSSGRTLMTNCHVNLDTCGTISEYIDIVDDFRIASISNCYITHSGTTDVYIGAKIFNGNIYSSSGGITYFASSVIMIGNYFDNHASDDIQVGLSGNGTATVIGNRANRACSYTSDIAYTKKEHNI